MQEAIGVRFKKAGRIEYYKPSFAEIRRGDWVVAETTRGLECGEVVIGPGEIASDALQLRSVRRRATSTDLEKLAENKEREREAFEICKEKIVEHNLPMKLINVEYMFDVNKIIFSFTSDGRVDFRNLVRDLAYVFKTRIELRQVGVRDETKLMNGIGNCGRPLCCANFLGDFVAVSIRMAKEQNLSLNPTKISGCCGRLMCCLQYEDANYHETGGLCGVCDSTIINLNAEDDSEALEKLEALEIVEENLEEAAPIEEVAIEDTPVKPIDRSERNRSGGSNEHRRFGGSNRNSERNSERGSDRRNAQSKSVEGRGERQSRRSENRTVESGASRRSDNRMSSKSNASDGSVEQNKKAPSKSRSRSKKAAYQRDKNFHSRRPDLNDV